MNNKVFGLTFAAVLSSGLLVFGASNAGAYAVDTWLFPAEEFGDNTYIGTTDVSNMEVEQAKGLFAGQSDIWRAASSLQVSYQDAVADYPIETIEILVDETLLNAENGVQNGFRFQLSPDTTAAFLAEHFPVASFSEADINTVNAKLAAALSAGQSQTLVTISDETLAVEREVIASASFTHTIKSAEGSAVASALDGFVIEPGMKFSFLDFITALPLVEITDGELSQIASAIYSAVLQSNLTVDERSIGSAAPVSVPLGKEAAINRQLGIDLVFTNPNESSVTLNVSLDSSAVKAELSGLPLVYDYEIQTGAEEKVEPRLIKQYSSFVASGSVVKEEGRNGMRVNVLRTILMDGKELEVEPISTDFYPPVHKIEVFALKAAEVPVAAVPKPGEPGFVDANGDGVHDAPATAVVPQPGEPGFVDANGDGVHDAPTAVITPQPGASGFIDTNGDGIHDAPVVVTPAPIAGDPDFVDEDGDGLHDWQPPVAPTPSTEEERDKGGNLVQP
ncbi:hypothetical protein HNQ44_002159 [Planomicrobium koreense]|uniref:G5 domain-containing protein n=1 Tax=Planococcus koreensis TaxID=112331 RepID=A0A7W8FUL4_9BACL|nr:VanW family protein [Planococcus koreensis]MBB5180730.1 hypothetical protein [Planococcus koreensis]